VQRYKQIAAFAVVTLFNTDPVTQSPEYPGIAERCNLITVINA
jgi:hypothetical protein